MKNSIRQKKSSTAALFSWKVKVKVTGEKCQGKNQSQYVKCDWVPVWKTQLLNSLRLEYGMGWYERNIVKSPLCEYVIYVGMTYHEVCNINMVQWIYTERQTDKSNIAKCSQFLKLEWMCWCLLHYSFNFSMCLKAFKNKHFGKKRQLSQLLPKHLPISLHLYPNTIFSLWFSWYNFILLFYSHYLQLTGAHHFYLPKDISTAIFPSLFHIPSVGPTY